MEDKESDISFEAVITPDREYFGLIAHFPSGIQRYWNREELNRIVKTKSSDYEFIKKV